MKWVNPVVALLLLVAGCQSNQSGPVLSPEKFTAATGETTPGAANANVAAPAATRPRVILPGAVISITVDQDRTLNRAYTVPISGAVNFPPLGRILVEGRTPKEVAEQIGSLWRRSIFRK
jgi:protein involved in polysaccharide export with SLBB domain